jgi:radical SAM superfamily enzyme YgiQ (UPF0313 family)
VSKVLLLSCYELGHQPLAVTHPAAHLTAAGHDVRAGDLSVAALDADDVAWADVVAISAPMHTAMRIAVRAARRVRDINPSAHVAMYGLYASLHAADILGDVADSAIGGEFERPLVALIDGLARGDGRATMGVRLRGHDGGTSFERGGFMLPARHLLPPLTAYSRAVVGGEPRLAGYVEGSRGCAHRCLHCPITPVYAGRLRLVPREIVLADIDNLVDMGARHITLGDPDFFNAVPHSVAIVEELHRRHPELSFDATIKVEHLLEHAPMLPRLAAAGCAFVVTAAEAVQDHVLGHLAKGHDARDLVTALRLADEAGLTLRPTFVAFTPWTSFDDYVDLLEFIIDHDLVDRLDTIQLAIRLLVPRGSALVGTRSMDSYLLGYDSAAMLHPWDHPDAGMDLLHARVTEIVTAGLRCEMPAGEIFAHAYRAACASADRVPKSPDWARWDGSRQVPHLTEPWFC